MDIKIEVTLALSLVPLAILASQLVHRWRKRERLSAQARQGGAASGIDPRLMRYYEQRVRTSLVGVLNVSALEIGIGIFLFCPAAHRWHTLVAYLPGLLILHHVSFLWLQSPAQASHIEGGAGADEVAASPPRDAAGSRQISGAARCRAVSTIDSYFSGQALMGRYGFLAMLLVLFGFLAFSVTRPTPPALGLDEESRRALQLGLVGAYAYVFLELGRRSIRNDITAGSIIWCLMTIVVGPGLAVLVHLVGGTTATGSEGLGNGIVLFFAGFAPRTVVALLEGLALRLLKVTTESAPTEDRRVPLTKIRGIGSEIQDRLIEEGVTDAHALANTEPVRLMRDTRFDMWQILSWVDEALLIVSFPKLWPALQEASFSRASELVALGIEWRVSEEATQRHPQDAAAAARLDRVKAQMKFLTDLGGVPEALVRRIIENLEHDPRVTHVQALMSFTPTGAFIAEDQEEQPRRDDGLAANGGGQRPAPGLPARANGSGPPARPDLPAPPPAG